MDQSMGSASASSDIAMANVDSTHKVLPSEITMVLCIRAHDGNPWVINRIRMMGDYYDPKPTFLVLDFGSSEPFAEQIACVCAHQGFEYIHIADYDTYSPAAAHNRGFEAVKTPFVYFCDADVFSFKTLFADLADTATELRMKEMVDIVLTPPVYHLNEVDSATFFSLPTAEEQSAHLKREAYRANFRPFNRAENFFVAPYSNVYMIHRDMFTMTGGYDERFRGHGSEDFEYLVRLAMHISHLPLPDEMKQDKLGPFSSEFFHARPYSGFRRLLEMASEPTFNMGFKIFHLWHPRETSNGDWYQNNDWKRVKMNEALDAYVDAPQKLLSIDFLNRGKRIACVCNSPDIWGYFTPLRVAGFELVPVFDNSVESISALSKGLIDGNLSGMAIFNPYMLSNTKFYETVVLARELGRTVIVIERGALPGTIYYDDDVSYVSENYSEERFLSESFSDEELRKASEYIDGLRSGDSTLEHMNSYDKTSEDRIALGSMTKPICFIPLQLPQDMAVTMFIRGEQSYPNFVESLPKVIDDNPDILFIVKPHPLSKGGAIPMKPNLIIAQREDNIHYLLDVASFVLCYNSGVGLLSILHQKPTITLGNAFYNLAGAGFRAASAAEAIGAFKRGLVKEPDQKTIRRIAAWFLHRQYSQFIATDNVREFTDRKAHAYKDILVTDFRYGGQTHKLGRTKQVAPFSWNSHSGFRIAATKENAEPAAQKMTPYEKIEKWAYDDYRRGEFQKSANNFRRAYATDSSNPNLLRFAAEAHLRCNEKAEALDALLEARKVIPNNQRLRRRILVIRYPLLRFILGDNAMAPS